MISLTGLVQGELKCSGGSALERLESVGEISVDEVIFGTDKRVGCAIGQYHDARLQVWGTGETISLAAEKCLAKLVEAGLVDAPMMIEAS